MTTQCCKISLVVKISAATKKKIMDLADEMAAASSERSAQSYDTLMRARKTLETELSENLVTTYNS